MVEHGAVERFGSGGETSGRAAVAVARPGVPARMVVREHDPAAAMRRRIGDDLADRKSAACLVALVTGQMYAVRVRIDMRDPEMLAAGILFRQAAGEERPRSRKAVELQRSVGTLISHCTEVCAAALDGDFERVRYGVKLNSVARSKMETINPLLAVAEPD